MKAQVRDNLLARTIGPAGVTREIGNYNLVFIGRIATYQALKFSFFAMQNPIRHTLGVIPFLNPEMRIPAWIMNLDLCRFRPLSIALKFQSYFTFLSWF